MPDLLTVSHGMLTVYVNMLPWRVCAADHRLHVAQLRLGVEVWSFEKRVRLRGFGRTIWQGRVRCGDGPWRTMANASGILTGDHKQHLRPLEPGEQVPMPVVVAA